MGSKYFKGQQCSCGNTLRYKVDSKCVRCRRNRANKYYRNSRTLEQLQVVSDLYLRRKAALNALYVKLEQEFGQ